MKPTISGDELAVAVGAEAAHELCEALQRITHCLGQLDDRQVWWRPGETQNSIGNLILHLSGNLRQWVVCGLGGGADTRNRPLEFSERRAIAKAELLAGLGKVVDEATKALAGVTAGELLRVRRIQGFEVTGLGAIFSSVPHFRGHTQEIICRTRMLLGDRYRFEWTPQTPEQGATA
jgi:hypothetical protein